MKCNALDTRESSAISCVRVFYTFAGLSTFQNGSDNLVAVPPASIQVEDNGESGSQHHSYRETFLQFRGAASRRISRVVFASLSACKTWLM